MESYSEEQGKRYHQDFVNWERSYQGQYTRKHDGGVLLVFGEKWHWWTWKKESNFNFFLLFYNLIGHKKYTYGNISFLKTKIKFTYIFSKILINHYRGYKSKKLWLAIFLLFILCIDLPIFHSFLSNSKIMLTVLLSKKDRNYTKLWSEVIYLWKKKK